MDTAQAASLSEILGFTSQPGQTGLVRCRRTHDLNRPLALPLAKLEQITMINADIKTQGNKLTITVDLSKEHGPSKSGKTIIIATSSGNQKIEGTDAIIGLNIYRKR
jgi:hypothetical protein